LKKVANCLLRHDVGRPDGDALRARPSGATIYNGYLN
jgi:hypothetical protein